ncbi:MAG: helicase HerA-like domain-containing protein, partial [Pseudomonadota bacterium]
GHPIRATVSEMGPLMLSRMLDLNDTQEGVLNVAFRVADEEGLLLLDLKDLRAMLVHVAERSKELTAEYGNVSKASVGAIQRRLLTLENQGGAAFFGEPALQLADMIRVGPDGRGQINLLAADRLMGAPRLYATFLLWLMSELFEELPEIGDPEKPVLVFFFDEAHLLFDDAPKALMQKIEMVVRLVRSKGVGVYFVTQNPLDVPDTVLGQLGNRVQHALRAFTPRDQRALKAAAETMRPNPAFDTAEAIRDVGVGEAVTSMLGPKGVPGEAQRTLIRPPASRLGPITEAERAKAMAASPVAGRYEAAIDRVSAFETLAARAEATAAEAETGEVPEPEEELSWAEFKRREAAAGGPADRAPSWRDREFRSARRYTGAGGGATPRRRSSRSDSVGTTFAKSIARSAGTQISRTLVRGVLGGLFRGR